MSTMKQEPLDWLTACELPWVQKRVMRDILGRSSDDAALDAIEKSLFSHPLIKEEIAYCRTWPGGVLKRHNTAGHPLNHLGFLVDLGFNKRIYGAKGVIKKLLAHRDKQTGAFESNIELPKVFGGTGKPEWCWMICDAPVLAHALYAFTDGEEPLVREALSHLASLSSESGWICHSSFPNVRGPGRKNDPCPIATLLCLKALALSDEHRNLAACRRGTEMLLAHWQQRKEKKYRMFGIGTDFQKLKYPFIWYDILHVVDVLTRFPWTHTDPRLHEMVEVILSKADERGRYKAESVWMPFKRFDFGQKREPSPMLTLMVMRIQRRLSGSNR